ncbi:succinylglutamate desuccinylase [Aliiglaciecola litoralis]|uniref:Succinylglutamate desuccinylase n=1 Tax=Aliiglaciecola litoralis TaxID=582857 RepID=A0ABN1LNE9_9ALTE
MPTEQLIASGQFLHLSRFDPQQFDTPVDFTLKNGTQVHISSPGIIRFDPPSTTTRSLVFSCGVHGNETAPIEICDAIAAQLLTGKLQVKQRVLFLFANLPAMDIAERFVEENMNRLFSGAHSQGQGINNQERERAKELELAVAQFFNDETTTHERIHYDLHTAIRASKNEKFAVYPFLHDKPRNKQQLAILHACGVSTILLSESPTTTFSYYSTNQFGAHGFTVELGKVQPFGQNDMAKFQKVRDTMIRLITELDPDFSAFNPEEMDIYRVNQVINKHFDDFKLHFADDLPNFTDFAKGQVIASETDTTYKCEYDGEAIVFPNANVAIGQRALLTVVPTKI